LIYVDLEGLSTLARGKIRQRMLQVAPDLQVSESSSEARRHLDAQTLSAIAASVSSIAAAATATIAVLSLRRGRKDAKDDDLSHVEAEVKARVQPLPPQDAVRRLLEAVEANEFRDVTFEIRDRSVLYELRVTRRGESYFLIGRVRED
jgi:hypothetical protein